MTFLNLNPPKPTDPEIIQLAGEHQCRPESILGIFQALQARHGGLTPTAIAETAHALNVPVERAYGVATFYSLLNVEATARGATARVAPTVEATLAKRVAPPTVVRVCDGPACWLRGAAKAQAELATGLGQEWRVERSSCLGLCDRAPAALVDGKQYGPLPSPATLIEHDQGGGGTPDYAQPRRGETRVLLARVGKVDPDSIVSALEHGAYQGLQHALRQPPSAVITEIELAGLAGRGGAGFPTGRKWQMVAQTQAAIKYVVCNADESEPLVFKDRVLIDSDPHQLLEGIAIAAYAVGAREAIIYIRGEYEPQAARLENAIRQAEVRGLFEHIGTGRLKIHVHRGAGAYICGEETALLESLEGKRGEPRLRPPYPTTAGYQGRPTLVNNVETFSSVPSIIMNGANWYRALGSDITPGTKLYTLLGHVNRPGLFEAPFRLTLRQIIDDFGGGMRPGSTFHFALTGGAAGTIVPAALLDMPIDYYSGAKGVSLGAGAFLICDQSVSPAALLRELLHFFESESCGRCTPCRIGTRQAGLILERLTAGRGKAEDATQLAALAELMRQASFCGLGQAAALPIQSALQHFAEAFKS